MIREFTGEYRWLSNFFECKIVLDDREYPSVEHAFQSAKCADLEWKEYCMQTTSAGIVKRKARSVKLIDDWDSKRILVMKECLHQKFSQEPFKTLLKKTGDIHLQEGNEWGDTFWGVKLSDGTGKNVLGKLIMEVRNKLKWGL